MSDSDTGKNVLYLLDQMPQVLRIRDFRLYTRDGRRIIDLWQNGGVSVLGHTPALLLREIKNTASRGLYAPFPHFSQQRFLKALTQILPGRSFRIFAAPPAGIYQFNFELWRPYLDFCQSRAGVGDPPAGAVPESRSPDLVIPVLPGIQGWRWDNKRSDHSMGLPFGLCVCAVLSERENEIFGKLQPTDIFPPLVLAAATRGVWDLIAARPLRVNTQWPCINKILKNSPWQGRGIYLFPREAPNPLAWEKLFKRFLDAGFLLPPVPEHPLILPGILSPGEEVKLAEILKE